MKEKLSKKLERTINIVKNIPNKKSHLDFIAALLTIPVLLSVIILNYSNLQKPKVAVSPTPTPSAVQTEKPVIIVSPSTAPVASNSPSPVPSCQKQVGPISITYPNENQTVSDNPLCIIISYPDSNYCSVVWSYRINGGTWSDYNSNSPCIYNLTNGNVEFDLRVQSTVSEDQKTLTRNFTYSGHGTIPTPTPSPSPTPTPTASSSASLQ